MRNFLTKVVLFLLICSASSLTLVSCKSKKTVVDASQNENRSTANKIIENYYNNKSNFSTLYIKANVQYVKNAQGKSASAEIKIKKDEQILISIRFLGITMAKASITPTTVSYYEKLNGTYYEGDFSSLSQFLGTDLDFNKIQNLLLGRAVDDLKKGKYKESFADQVYRLDDISGDNTRKSFYFDANKFLVNKQEITQTSEERTVRIVYLNPKEFNELTLPLSININTFQKKGNAEINLDYSTVTFNDEISFPYSVPNGYNRIIIK